jgi:Uma2 family endonuclease
MATTTGLLTVEQFAALPRTDTRDELVDGEVISMPPPELLHNFTSSRLANLLRPLAGDGYVGTEVPFRPNPERASVRIADVAWVGKERLNQSSLRGYLRGAPELVAEVLSPSNTTLDMNRRRREAFDGDCLEFWIVDPESKTIEVSLPDGTARTYSAGEQVPVGPLGGVVIPTEAVFAD